MKYYKKPPPPYNFKIADINFLSQNDSSACNLYCLEIEDFQFPGTVRFVARF